MKSGKVLLGVLAGIAAGAVLGILFAPDKGSTTRKQILTKGEDYADALKEKFNDLTATMAESYKNTSEEATDLLSKGKVKYNEIKKDVKNSTI